MWKKIPVLPELNLNGVYTAFIQDMENGYYFPGESHNFWEIACVQDGSMTVTADERIYELKKNDIIFHRPLEFHRFLAGENGLRLMVISFSATGKLLKYFEKKTFSLTSEEVELFSELINIADKIISRSGLPFPVSDNLHTKLDMLFKQFILDVKGNRNSVKTVLNRNSALYEKIINILKKNIDSTVTLDEIAEECHTSKSNLKRIFSMYSDISIKKYFNQLKISKAMKLLKQGYSGNETALSLGFDNPNYFYTVFKNQTGVTVKEFQKNSENY